MRILLIAPMVPQDKGSAIPILLRAQLDGLSARNEVTYVSSFAEEPGEEEAAREVVAAGYDIHLADRRVPAEFGRRWRRRARLASSWATSGRPWRVLWYAEPAIQGIVDRLAATRQFDVIAIEDSPMSVFDLPPGIPTVYTEHEALRAPADSWGSQRISDRPMQMLRRRDWERWPKFQPTIWPRYDLLQTYSAADAAVIVESAPELSERIRINPFGTVLPPALDPAAVVEGTILFVGNFTHPPNRDAAVWLAESVMPVVWARSPEARLRIVGMAPPREVLELAGPRVDVFGDAPSVKPHLEAAAVVTAPVRTGGGMRMKVLEAMAGGKAVAATPLGADGYTQFDEAPPLALGESAEELGTAIAELMVDPERRRQMGIEARRFAERHHSPEAWAKRLEAIYEEARELGGRKER
jgi:glycosyltransferase involved in cell wall biosynthesis